MMTIQFVTIKITAIFYFDSGKTCCMDFTWNYKFLWRFRHCTEGIWPIPFSCDWKSFVSFHLFYFYGHRYIVGSHVSANTTSSPGHLLSILRAFEWKLLFNVSKTFCDLIISFECLTALYFLNMNGMYDTWCIKTKLRKLFFIFILDGCCYGDILNHFIELWVRCNIENWLP